MYNRCVSSGETLSFWTSRWKQSLFTVTPSDHCAQEECDYKNTVRTSLTSLPYLNPGRIRIALIGLDKLQWCPCSDAEQTIPFQSLCRLELSLLGAESGSWELWWASLDSCRTQSLRGEFPSQSGHFPLKHKQHLFLHQFWQTVSYRMKKKKLLLVSNHHSLSHRSWFAQLNSTSCPMWQDGIPVYAR